MAKNIKNNSKEYNETKSLQITLLYLLDHFCYQIRNSNFTSKAFEYIHTLFDTESPFYKFFEESASTLEIEKNALPLDKACVICKIDELTKNPTDLEFPKERISTLVCNHSIHNNVCAGIFAMKYVKNEVSKCSMCDKASQPYRIISGFDKELWEKRKH